MLVGSGLLDALIANGKKVLRSKYPTPEEKWLEQLQVLEEVGRSGRP